LAWAAWELQRAAGASTLIGAVSTNAFAALALDARHGLQRVCVYGVPLIGVNSVSGFVTMQSVQVRTRLIEGTDSIFSWTRLSQARPTGTGLSSGGRRALCTCGPIVVPPATNVVVLLKPGPLGVAAVVEPIVITQQSQFVPDPQDQCEVLAALFATAQPCARPTVSVTLLLRSQISQGSHRVQ
jgi:hypothetical protein